MVSLKEQGMSFNIDRFKINNNELDTKFLDSSDYSDYDTRHAAIHDRDRILFSTEFRRLQGKTQVFISGFDDQVRNRLTHTIEVAQIAVTIARTLGLNASLTQAMAYGHDVGHTPFGHIGERVLNMLTNNCFFIDKHKEFRLPDDEKGFKHNLQSGKVVQQLEYYDSKEKGLGLSSYTIWGIVNHTKTNYKKCNGSIYCNHINDCPFRKEFSLSHYDRYIIDDKYASVEARIVALADEIAQRHHDVEDGIYAGLLTSEDFAEIFEQSGILLNEDKPLVAK